MYNSNELYILMYNNTLHTFYKHGSLIGNPLDPQIACPYKNMPGERSREKQALPIFASTERDKRRGSQTESVKERARD